MHQDHAGTPEALAGRDAIASGAGDDWRRFAVIGAVVLPVAMVGAFAAYGFVVWMLQVFFLGPPT